MIFLIILITMINLIVLNVFVKYFLGEDKYFFRNLIAINPYGYGSNSLTEKVLTHSIYILILTLFEK
jgi:hypothetical protein